MTDTPVTTEPPATCPFPGIDHSGWYCPVCEPKTLTPAQQARLEAMIKERGWQSL